jgi:photosynthetic reaction center H subunit
MSDELSWSFPGAPMPEVENPMQEGVGAASWTKTRADRTDLTLAGEPKIVPMSGLEDWHVEPNDPDPHGMTVYGADGEPVGQVNDLWVDRSEPAIKYLQIATPNGNVLAPMGFCRVTGGEIRVQALYAAQFAGVPKPKATDKITLLEEDRIAGYFAGGYRYADDTRNDPLF